MDAGFAMNLFQLKAGREGRSSDATALLRDEVAMDFKNLQVAKLIWRACEGFEEPLYSVFKRVTSPSDLF